MRPRWVPAAATIALVMSGMGCGRGPVFGIGPRAAPIGTTGTTGTGAGPETTAAPLGTGELADHDDESGDPPGDATGELNSEPSGIAVPDPPPLGSTPTASRYAALDRQRCEAELGKRHIPYDPVAEARGVIAPLRLKGAIGGVEFRSMLPAAQRKTSPYEIYDCRLVLALDDWARVLARHDVVQVVHFSVYRPPSAKAVLHGPGRRHTGALAIDAAIFKMRDGSSMSVEKDFHGRIGGKPCSASSRAASTNGLSPQATKLRQIVCEAADAQLFNVMLTPDYNWPHRNHFHLEVTAGARWVLVR